MEASASSLTDGHILRCGRFVLMLDCPRIMGIVNITPDSFSDGGAFLDAQRAVDHAHRLVEEGADLLDLGAESTRPGAAPVSADEELDRLLPVLTALARLEVPISIDTSKPVVMREAMQAGAAMINDVNAFRAAGAIEALAKTAAALCVMHMRGEPRTMQAHPTYVDVVGEVDAFLRERIAALADAGVAHDRIAIDPGFGFGKNLDHNLALLRALQQFSSAGVAVLVGLSRKSMLGNITGRPAHERLPASIAAALLAVERGAQIVRVHDVAATRDALAILAAVQRADPD
ncbi:MAG: dihydropteroate synthase [Betaproteobacteria bacterium]|nr:dihydropteroate synthase [Betaproteobacteria bacterium]